MPAYLVNSGVKQRVSDGYFDLLSSDCEIVKKRNGDWRKQDNGYYNTKPNDENYFKKYYLEKLKHEWICDRCGKTLK